MGIDNTAARMLVLLSRQPQINLNEAIILGRQRNYIGTRLRKRLIRELRLPRTSIPLDSSYADEFLEVLGFKSPKFLDLSGYEGASVLHDLNTPIPSELRSNYSTVIDIGTSEHIFNISQSIQNLKDLCKTNGYVLIVSPANNWLGHGFFQFSPELFFVLLIENLGLKLSISI